MSAYLDTSAIIKRYFKEENSDKVDEIFNEAWQGKTNICFSSYNVGEVVGVVDRLKNSRKIDERIMKDILDKFFSETLQLLRLKTLVLVPVNTETIFKSIPIIISNHVYIADALQIISCIDVNCKKFYTADKRLGEAAKKVGVNVEIL
jgi:predicted nucleic acid-binding protein